MTVTYLMGGTAIEGPDYTVNGPHGQVVIPAGQTSVTIPLHANNDAAHERSETIKLKLNSGNAYKLPRRVGKSATIKIVNVP